MGVAMVKYSIGDYEFKTEEFFSERILNAITDVRVNNPAVVLEEAKKRVRRKALTRDGRLTILAADQAAGLVSGVKGEPVAMGDRLESLGRVLRVIALSDFDGMVATPDLVEDLLIVNHLVKGKGGPGFLDEKVILGSMGLPGEMDDRFASFTAEAIERMRLDGAKLTFRLEEDEIASDRNIERCAEAIVELNRLGVPVFLEALPVKMDAEALVKIISIAPALGDSSARTWLMAPYCQGYERVARTTTLPILMVDDEAPGDPRDMLEGFAQGMRSGANVRGVSVGREVLLPGRDDPLAVAMAIYKVVHEGFSVKQALMYLMESRGRDMDFLMRWMG